jgi:hypothetical protein
VATDQFLTASLSLDREGTGTDDFDASDETFAARYASVEAELVRRLEAEPGVTDVVLAEAVPGDEPKERFDVEATAPTATAGKRDAAPASAAGFLVGVGRVDLAFLRRPRRPHPGSVGRSGRAERGRLTRQR